MTTATTYVHGGDYDCSEAVRMCYRAAGVLPYGSYMWTGNERELLAENGFERVSLYAPQRGDVLWKPGHTEMHLGDGMQGGARIDETGGTTGPRKGDQTGREIVASAYDKDAWGWQSAWRYLGGVTLEGIPAAEVAAQVMEHLIAHDAGHGYSQDNRAGDGTIEAVTITWEEGSEPDLEVDGWLGALSVTAWQRALCTYADGIVSGQDRALREFYPHITAVEYGAGGSSLVVAIQRVVGATADGIIGPDTVRRLQRWLVSEGYEVGGIDGYLGSNTAKAVQKSLNAGKW